MSTTGVEERLVEGEEHVSLRHITDAIRRLDELGIARLIGDAAELVHKAQKGGQPVGTLTLDAIHVLSTGRVELALAKAPVSAYTAPERLRGAPGDRRSDVFSLGVVMWEALAHARLFEGKTDDLVKAAVQTSEWRSTIEHNANVPAELDAICKKALARDPADRYQSAKVMAAEISAVLDDASYPEGNDDIARYLAREFPEGPPKPGRQRMAETPIPGTVKTQAKDDTGKVPKVGTQTVLGMAPLRDEVVKAKTPSAGVPAKTPTPAAGVAAKTPTPDPEAKPAVAVPVGSATVMGPQAEPPRPRTPTPSALPAWATGNAPPPPADPRETAPGRPESSLSPTVLTSHPGMRVPATPPGAEAIANPTKTAIMGSNAGAELQAALAAAAAGSAPAPKPFKSIKEAETVDTPALAATVAPPKRPTPQPPPERVAVAAASPSAVVEAQTPHPASVVALPRAQSRGDKTGTGGSKDVLAGWGWGTDKLDALVDDDHYEDTQRSQRKRVLIAVGGAVGAIMLIAVVALAFGGGDSDTDKKKQAAAAKAAAAPPAVQWGSSENQPTPPPAPPPAPAPAPQAAAPEPAPPPPAPAPTTEPPKPEPAQQAAAEPPKPEPTPPPAPPPPPPEPPKVAKPEPAPKKAPARKPEVVARKAEPKKTAPKPIDPYAATPATAPKADPAAAYKAGLLQFARGDSNGALATFRSSLAADPSYAPTWRGIGLVYEKLGKKAQARTAFRKYLSLNPSAGDAEQIRERLDRLGS